MVRLTMRDQFYLMTAVFVAIVGLSALIVLTYYLMTAFRYNFIFGIAIDVLGYSLGI